MTKHALLAMSVALTLTATAQADHHCPKSCWSMPKLTMPKMCMPRMKMPCMPKMDMPRLPCPIEMMKKMMPKNDCCCPAACEGAGDDGAKMEMKKDAPKSDAPPAPKKKAPAPPKEKAAKAETA